jgi:hypothetical protein
MVVYGPSLPTLPTAPSAPAAPSTGVETAVANKQASSAAVNSDGPSEQSLWGVLTDEERAFFAQQAELGALTYGPRGAKTEQLEPPKGQRLDVRV